MCCWTDGKLREVKQTKGQQIHGPFFFSHPPQPTFTTQRPAPQNCSDYVLLFCFHDWNFQQWSSHWKKWTIPYWVISAGHGLLIGVSRSPHGWACVKETVQSPYKFDRMDQSCYDELGLEEGSSTRNNSLSLRELKTTITYTCNRFDITNNTVIHKRNSSTTEFWVFLFKAHSLKFNLVTLQDIMANSNLNQWGENFNHDFKTANIWLTHFLVYTGVRWRGMVNTLCSQGGEED